MCRQVEERQSAGYSETSRPRVMARPIATMWRIFSWYPCCRMVNSSSPTVSAKVIAAVTDLLVHPHVVFLISCSISHHASVDPQTGTPDNAYFRISDPLKGTATVALHDASRENGTLKVIPRQFHIKHPHDRDPDSDHHIRMKADDDDAVHCELKRVASYFLLWHRTRPVPTSPMKLDVWHSLS